MKKLFCWFVLFFFIKGAFSQIPTGYYNNTAGLSGSPLKVALYNIIKNHNEFPYTSSSTDVWDILQHTDQDPNDTTKLLLVYTGRPEPKANMASGANAGEQNFWNREHVWPQSNGGFTTATGPGTDVHNLKPADVSVNGYRGNLNFDNGGSAHPEAVNCKFDSDSWEPRNEVKGDIARMVFYMATRYIGQNGDPNLSLVDYVNTTAPNFGKISTLLQWHLTDTVDAFERRRNNLIYSHYQGNRNPYIDHPEFAVLVFDSANAPLFLPEPSNHVTNFKKLPSITIRWTDPSTGTLPDGYLVIGSTVGFQNIVPPIDGIYQPNDFLIKNIPFGVQNCTFDGLNYSTTYYFKVFPYFGAGVNINYKTNGVVPSISKTTPSN